MHSQAESLSSVAIPFRYDFEHLHFSDDILNEYSFLGYLMILSFVFPGEFVKLGVFLGNEAVGMNILYSLIS